MNIPSQEKSNVWLDCDPGCDDAFALLIAAFSDKINLLGISTVSGNQVIKNMTKNTLSLLYSIGFVAESVENSGCGKSPDRLGFKDCWQVGGLKVPVIEGCGIPFLGKPVTASYIHGETGLEGDWPSPPKHAVDYVQTLSSQNHFTEQIYRFFKSFGQPITILATGPLTNIALLLFNFPDIRQYIEKIVFMGGSMGLGNTGPLSEFNIHADPLAASMVCESGLSIYMVPLDSTNEALFSPHTVARITQLDSRFGRLFAHLLAHLLDTCRWTPALHDPVAAFFLVEPEAFATKLVRVDVECSLRALNYAQTVCDFNGKTQAPKNVHICYRVDVARFWDKMHEIIRQADKASSLK